MFSSSFSPPSISNTIMHPWPTFYALVLATPPKNNQGLPVPPCRYQVGLLSGVQYASRVSFLQRCVSPAITPRVPFHAQHCLLRRILPVQLVHLPRPMMFFLRIPFLYGCSTVVMKCQSTFLGLSPPSVVRRWCVLRVPLLVIVAMGGRPRFL